MKSDQVSFLSISTTVILLFSLSVSAFSAVLEGEKNADGSFLKWHRIEVVFGSGLGCAAKKQCRDVNESLDP